MKINKIFLFLLLCIVLSSFVSAAAVCSLDKETYHPGENSVFTCVCSSPIEENRAGYIVWRNTTNDILYSVAANSGSCRSLSFGNQYIFEPGADYLGNVTFSLNADGTGTPTNWGNIDDINYDTFNVSGADSTDCTITPTTYSNGTINILSVNLGETGSLEFTVKDGLTGYTLTHAQCEVTLFNSITNLAIFQEPLRSTGVHHVETGAYGLGYINHDFTEKVLTPDTQYKYQVNCYCINNSDEQCYYGDGGLGAATTFKECTTNGIFISGKDKRIYPLENLALIIALGIFTFLILYIAFKLENKHFILQLILIIISIISLFLMSSINVGAFSSRAFNFLQLGMWLLRIFFFYVVIYLVYEILKWKKIMGGNNE